MVDAADIDVDVSSDGDVIADTAAATVAAGDTSQSLSNSSGPMSVEQSMSSGSVMGSRVEIKHINAVALWSWDIEVDTCAICRNIIMD